MSRYIDEVLSDIRFALRLIGRRPAFAAITVVTLVIGIGGSTAVFSVFDRVILRPLPYVDPDRLVNLWQTRSTDATGRLEASYADFMDWKRRSRTLENLVAYNGANFTLSGFGAPFRVSAMGMTANTLSVLGVHPQMGRDFSPDDETPSSRVVMVSDRFWRRELASRADVVGGTLRLSGVPYAIVGVLPAEFQFMRDEGVDFFVPLAPTGDQRERRDNRWLAVLGRLKPGATHEQASADLRRIAQELETEFAATNRGMTVRLIPLHEQVTGAIRPVLSVVFAASVVMLCVALVNLANLVVAQLTIREREMAIRRALGAGTVRLGRQLLAECVLIGLMSGAAALAVAHWTLQIAFPLLALNAGDGLMAASGAIDFRVILFSLTVALLGAAFAAAVGAARLSRTSLRGATNAGATASVRQKTRTALTVAEVGLSVALLVNTIVMVQSVYSLLQVDPGFKTAQLATMNLSLPAAQYPGDQNVASFYRELQRRLSATPGIEGAAVIDELPLTRNGRAIPVVAYGQTLVSGTGPEAWVRTASPGYFETMGIPVLSGRAFSDSDTPGRPPVVVLNQRLAADLFGGDSAVGRRLVTPMNADGVEIVGVVGDVRLAGLDQDVRPTMYLSGYQTPSRSSALVVRSAADVASGVTGLVAAVQAEVQRMDPELPVYAARSIEDTIAGTPGVVGRRLVLYLVSAFSLIAVALAGIGLYGLMSFLVSQRAKEIGIRMALGAGPATVRRLVLGQAMRLTWAGLAVGTFLSGASGKMMQNVAFGVTPTTPAVLVLAAVVVTAIAFLSAYAPICRAARIEPTIALRQT